MNEDIYQMIDTLHARLDDVRAAVDSLESDAPGFAKRLDKLDDSLYLLQLDLEKHAKSPLQENESSPSAEEDNVKQASKTSASESDEDNESFCLTRRRTILRMQENNGWHLSRWKRSGKRAFGHYERN